jgi:tetratricopeptide (TPR) repeat protein
VHFLVTVAVLVYAPQSGGAGARQAEATAALVAAERAAGAEVVEDPFALVAAGWTAERNLAFFARAAQLVSDGRRALAHVELERAEGLFAQAEVIFTPEEARPAVRQEWADAALWHGVALFELKRRSDAIDAWKRAKSLYPDTLLTEAMVRPDVARAFAAVARPPTLAPAPARSLPEMEPPSVGGVEALRAALGLDEVIVVAIALDGGVLTYAATRRPGGCGTETLTSTRADELVKRLAAQSCLAEEKIAVLEAPVIAHPRPSPSVANGGGGATVRDRRTPLWKRPWLWVGVVGALGLGVVLAVNLWPRDATYSAALDFHQFALGAR